MFIFIHKVSNWLVIIILFFAIFTSSIRFSRADNQESLSMEILIKKVKRLRELAAEKADKGFNVSEALKLGEMSREEANKGNLTRTNELLEFAIKSLEELTDTKKPVTKIINIPVDAKKVKVTNVVPKFGWGREVKDFESAFNIKTIFTKDGIVSLEITSEPVYIEEISTTPFLKGKTESSPFGIHPAYTYKQARIDRKQLNWLIVKPQKFLFDYTNSLDIGVKWHRPEIYALWDIVQKSDSDIEKGVFNWETTDYVYGSVPEGINIIANIEVAESRTLKKEFPFPKTFRFKTGFLEEKYINFVKKLVERYDGDGIDDMPSLKNPVKYWQVSNEPDAVSKDWEGYAHLLEITYKAVKETCATCKVASGGLFQFPEGVHNFYAPVLKKLKGKYIDIFDFHPYGDKLVWKTYEEIVNAIKKGLSENGYNKTEIWITETGTYSGKPETIVLRQTEKEQANGLVKMYTSALSLGVKKIFWSFGLMEGFTDANKFFDHTGMIYDGKGDDDQGYGGGKLSYYTYKMLTEKLEGCNFSDVQSLKLWEGVYAYKFNKSGKTVYVVWTE